MEWINKMGNHSFLAIYDVMLDIKQESDISPANIEIPLLPTIIKFPQLFPADAINTRDNYCDVRWKALKFLKNKEIIKSFELIEYAHRWEHKLEIFFEKGKFEEILNKMSEEYKKRTGSTENKVSASFWNILHPKIVKISKSRFESNYFADSVEAALKEINNIVKVIVKEKTGNEFDGADLMSRAFSLNDPIIKLGDIGTKTGKNTQIGYMQVFSGAMTGIRNPKAHENIVITRERAIHFLFLASLLMSKLDESLQ